MTQTCEHCGAENPALAKYCRQCGQPCAQALVRSATRVTPVMQQWRRLKHRMTRKEVRTILGEPARIETSASGEPLTEQWSYEYESPDASVQRFGGTIEFALPDGTVARWTEPDWSRVGRSARPQKIHEDRTMAQRLSGDDIAAFLAECPDELCDLVLALRDLVTEVASQCTEAIKFGSLCYFKPDVPYGSIGGNVCMIGWREDRVTLGFIHGAALPDPSGLLRGTAKAKRFVEIRTREEIARPAIRNLIQAALAYSPL